MITWTRLDKIIFSGVWCKPTSWLVSGHHVSSSHERGWCHFFPVSSYEGSFLASTDLPRAPSLNITHWRLEFQHEFGDGWWITNIQPIIEVFFSKKKKKYIQNDFSISNVGYSVLIYLFLYFSSHNFLYQKSWWLDVSIIAYLIYPITYTGSNFKITMAISLTIKLLIAAWNFLVVVFILKMYLSSNGQ